MRRSARASAGSSSTQGGWLILHQQSIRHEGWPLRFSPPSDQLEQRITALENAVAALQALHGGS